MHAPRALEVGPAGEDHDHAGRHQRRADGCRKGRAVGDVLLVQEDRNRAGGQRVAQGTRLSPVLAPRVGEEDLGRHGATLAPPLRPGKPAPGVRNAGIPRTMRA